jgi:hypothetical protein
MPSPIPDDAPPTIAAVPESARSIRRTLDG